MVKRPRRPLAAVRDYETSIPIYAIGTIVKFLRSQPLHGGSLVINRDELAEVTVVSSTDGVPHRYTVETLKAGLTINVNPDHIAEWLPDGTEVSLSNVVVHRCVVVRAHRDRRFVVDVLFVDDEEAPTRRIVHYDEIEWPAQDD